MYMYWTQLQIRLKFKQLQIYNSFTSLETLLDILKEKCRDTWKTITFLIKFQLQIKQVTAGIPVKQVLAFAAYISLMKNRKRK